MENICRYGLPLQGDEAARTAQEFYQGARDVIYRIKVTLHNSELRTSLEQSLLRKRSMS